MDTFVLPSGESVTSARLAATVASDIDDRLREHQRAIRDRGDKLGPPTGGLVLLAHGDSWFDYPCGGVGGGYSDVVFALNGRMGAPEKMQILDFAHWGATLLGDTIRDAPAYFAKNVAMTANPKSGGPPPISGDFMLGQISRAIKDSANGKFEGILLSAGGNDFAGDRLASLLNDARDSNNDPDRALNDHFRQLLKEIKAGFQAVIDFRDDNLPGTPIFVNGYGDAIPSGHAVFGNQKAWLQPSLIVRHWYDTQTKDLALGTLVVAKLLSEFREAIESLGQNVFLVNTWSVVSPSDWVNELHLKRNGFEKVANVMVDALRLWPNFRGRV